MKKSTLRSLVLGALAAGVFAFAPQADAAVQVNPIPNLPADFIKGADVSMLPELEACGGKFYDMDGTQMDELAIMKKYGINWIRLRIWNNPAHENGGGYTTAERALAMTKRAHVLGMKVLIDFHYSDFWADPGKQWAPKAWEKDSAKQVEKDVYDYTKKVLGDFKAAGELPEMVQVGNEITNGMIWPLGKLPSADNGKTLASFVASGLKAVHDTDAGIKTMIHIDKGGDNAASRTFYDQLINTNGVKDFDVIGLSYYPFWHGNMQQMQANINDLAARYGKDVVIVETAFGYTNENFDDTKNPYDAQAERVGGFRSTVQGQATGLRTVMQSLANVPGGKGIGMFYWEPDWYAVDGVGWKTGAGNNWAKTPFTFNVYQELTDLPDGVYAAEVTTQGKGDAKSFDRYVIGDNGEKKTAAIQDSGWTNWRTVRIDGITIKGGKATVGIEQQGNGDNWGSIDNVKFYRKL